MKRIQVMILAIVAGILTSCASIYKNVSYDQKMPEIKKMAILPFEVHVKPVKNVKNKTIEMDAKIQIDEGYRLQNETYIELLKKNTQLQTSIQDVSLTNSILKEAGIELSNIKSISKKDLAEILGVDMVLSGEVFTKKPVSTGGAIAISAATSLITPFGLLLPFVIPTNEVNMDINLHQKDESELMWKYHHTITGGLGSTPESISNILVKEVMVKIPVIKKKEKKKK